MSEAGPPRVSGLNQMSSETQAVPAATKTGNAPTGMRFEAGAGERRR